MFAINKDDTIYLIILLSEFYFTQSFMSVWRVACPVGSYHSLIIYGRNWSSIRCRLKSLWISKAYPWFFSSFLPNSHIIWEESAMDGAMQISCSQLKVPISTKLPIFTTHFYFSHNFVSLFKPISSFPLYPSLSSRFSPLFGKVLFFPVKYHPFLALLIFCWIYKMIFLMFVYC